MTGAFAVVSALLAREKQGIAQRVDSPQLGAMLTLESLGFTDYMQRQDADRVMSSDRARQTRDDGVLSVSLAWLMHDSSTAKLLGLPFPEQP